MKKKIVLSSVLSIVLCLSLIVGSTFALFTSEDKTNIAITSGDVEVVATIDESKIIAHSPTYINMKGEIENNTNAASGLVFKNGGTVAYDAPNATLVLTNVTPGDKVDFEIDVENKSSVAIQYRVVVSDAEGGSVNGFVFSVNGLVYSGDTVKSDWKTVVAKGDIQSVPVSIELPASAGNEHQGKTTKFAIIVEAVQGNALVGDFTHINGVMYNSLADAIAAAPDGAVINVGGDVAYDIPVNASNTTYDLKNVTIVGPADEPAVLTVNGNGANNTLANVILKNIVLVDKTTSYNEGSWELGYLKMANVTAENVVFANGIMIDGGSSTTFALTTDNTFVNCTFTGKYDGGLNMYGVWVNSGSASFENCTFVGTRGLKIHEAYESEVSAVYVNGCTFKSLTEKPGVALGTLNAATIVSLTNNTFYNVQPGDQGLYIYESDTGVNTFTFVNTDNTVDVEVAPGFKYYQLNDVEYYTVLSAEGMFNFADQVNVKKKSFDGKLIKLDADIDLKNAPWTPIGRTGNNEFHGIFDGQGHTIQNLNVDTTGLGRENEAAAGLFGWVSDYGDIATAIKNVTVSGATINSGKYAGTVVGFATGSVLIDSCNVENVTVKGTRAGAVAGYQDVTVKVNNCKADIATVIGTDSVGEVVGYEQTPALVTNCSATNVKLIVAGQEAFKTAIAAIPANGTGTVTLAAGTYTMPAVANKTVTITGTKDAILSLPKNVTCTGSTINFKDITIQGYAGSDVWHTGQLAHAKKATYENCTIMDLITTYCPSDFTDCVFENSSTAKSDWYSVFAYGMNCNITNCTFNTTASKAVKLFSEGAQEATLNVTNCKFFGSFFDKAAIEIDSTHTTKYTVNIKGCTMNEFYKDLYKDKSDTVKSVVTVS